MSLVLFSIPFLVFLFSFLVLTYAGRNFREKFTILLYNPDDVGRDSSGLINVLRVSFWISFLVSSWIIIGIIRSKI
ncbi:MAG: hypothetical protein OEW04_07915 [Nitrospirota bacterium]|nr:hypothetical protein [Nitrospirota bacterium]